MNGQEQVSIVHNNFDIDVDNVHIIDSLNIEHLNSMNNLHLNALNNFINNLINKLQPVTPFMPIGIPNSKSISGSWTSTLLQMAIYWPNTTRAIMLESSVGPLPATTTTLQTTLKFTVKASGMGGRGVAGDGGCLNLTLALS